MTIMLDLTASKGCTNLIKWQLAAFKEHLVIKDRRTSLIMRTSQAADDDAKKTYLPWRQKNSAMILPAIIMSVFIALPHIHHVLFWKLNTTEVYDNAGAVVCGVVSAFSRALAAFYGATAVGTEPVQHVMQLLRLQQGLRELLEAPHQRVTTELILEKHERNPKNLKLLPHIYLHTPSNCYSFVYLCETVSEFIKMDVQTLVSPLVVFLIFFFFLGMVLVARLIVFAQPTTLIDSCIMLFVGCMVPPVARVVLFVSNINHERQENLRFTLASHRVLVLDRLNYNPNDQELGNNLRVCERLLSSLETKVSSDIAACKALGVTVNGTMVRGIAGIFVTGLMSILIRIFF